MLLYHQHLPHYSITLSITLCLASYFTRDVEVRKYTPSACWNESQIPLDNTTAVHPRNSDQPIEHVL
jgi:hypothetical protein